MKDFSFSSVHIQAVFEIKDRSIEEILKTLDKLAVSPDELEHWIMSIETTAKGMSHDEGDKIDFEYYPEEKVMNSLKRTLKPGMI